MPTHNLDTCKCFKCWQVRRSLRIAHTCCRQRAFAPPPSMSLPSPTPAKSQPSRRAAAPSSLPSSPSLNSTGITSTAAQPQVQPQKQQGKQLLQQQQLQQQSTTSPQQQKRQTSGTCSFSRNSCPPLKPKKQATRDWAALRCQTQPA